jgi:hypothetical protein
MGADHLDFTDEDRRSMIATATKLLGYSKLFFGAFAVRKEREKGWQFLYVILQGQEDGRLNKRTLTSGNEAFARLVDHASDKFKALIPVLQHFNEVQVFVEPVRRKTGQVREFKLTKAFDAAVEKYLREFYALYNVDITEPTKQLDVAAQRALLKEIYSFQYEKLFSAWTDLIDALATFAHINREDFAHEMRNKAPYWAIILSCWNDYLEHANSLFDLQSIDDAVKAAMLSTNPIEVVACFEFLTDGQVCFLVRDKDNPRKFRFNEIFADAMVTYTRKVGDLETKLHALALELLIRSSAQANQT